MPGPEATGHGHTLLAALRSLWPSYLGYVLSFVTLGIMWANHHSMFHYIRRCDRYFVLINVVFLMCIAFLPFPTALLAEYLPEAEGGTTAVAVYSATLVVIAIMYNVMWRYAIHDDHLLGDGVDRQAVNIITQRYLLGPISYGASFVLAFVNVWASLAVHAGLAALYLLPEKGRNLSATDP